MSKVRFRIVASLDRGGRQAGTVTIDRTAALFAVRPLRRRREFVLPLSTVAEMVVHRLIKSEIASKGNVRRKRGRIAR